MQVLIRHRRTKELKYVPEGAAEIIANEDFLKKDWEVVERSSSPYEVVQFIENRQKEIEKVKEEKESTSVSVEELSVEQLEEILAKKKAGAELEPELEFPEKFDTELDYLTFLDTLTNVKDKIRAKEIYDKTRAEPEKEAEADITTLTVRQIEQQLDAFTEEQLLILQTDERVSVRRLVEKKLKK